MQRRRTGNDAALRRWAIVLFAVTVASDVGHVVLSRGLHDQAGLTEPLELDVAGALSVIVPGVVGLVLCWARPRNPIGWIIAVSGLMLGLCDLGQAYGARAVVIPEEHLPLGTLVLSLSAPLWIAPVFLPASMLLVRYPSGRISGRWARRFDKAVLVGLLLIWVAYAASKNSVTDVVRGHEPPLLLPGPVAAGLALVALVLLLGGTIAIVVDASRRVVRGRRGERMALLLLLTAAVLAVLLIMLGPSGWPGTVGYFGILVAVTVGVLRYQALGIEVVVRRTLIYALLTGVVLLVFGAVVTVLARVAPSGPLPEIAAATLIAVGLTPARDRIQALIDRVLYGDRDDPFAALSRLSTPMGTSGDAELLPDVLAALGEALHVQGASVVTSGEAVEDAVAVPLTFGGQGLGDLVVLPRRGERALSAADVRLVESVAPLVAAVVHAVRLADDLRLERARVIDATQLERGRLRQELHDGLGPSLTGIGLGLEAAQRNGASDELLDRLRAEVATSLEEVRRIIDDLQPSALDDQDLLAALRRRTEQVTAAAGLEVELTAPVELPALPAPVAVAAFRIADEALTNVVRHAEARHCRVELSVDGQLHLVVSDDGNGPGPGREGGVGLLSMQERAERLGGTFTLRATHPGTAVHAELPLELGT